MVTWWLMPGLLVLVGVWMLLAFSPQPPTVVFGEPVRTLTSRVSAGTPSETASASDRDARASREVPENEVLPSGPVPAPSVPAPSVPAPGASAPGASAPKKVAGATRSQASVTLSGLDALHMEDYSKLYGGWSGYVDDVEDCLGELTVDAPIDESLTIVVSPKWNGGVRSADILDELDVGDLPSTLTPINATLRSCFAKNIPSWRQLSMPTVNATDARVTMTVRVRVQ